MLSLKLDQFSGPLDLLLKMIEKEKMDITKVSLIHVADQYLEYIKKHGIKLEEISDFLVIAARLILIKSRALLPYLSQEEEIDSEEFTQALKMYKEFLAATEKIEAIINRREFMFKKETNFKNIAQKNFNPPPKLDQVKIAQTFREIVKKLNKEIKPRLEQKSIEKEIHIEDKIIELKNILKQKIILSFQKLLADAQSKTEIIVSFLGLLELMKQREVLVTQDELFQDIFIKENECNYE